MDDNEIKTRQEGSVDVNDISNNDPQRNDVDDQSIDNTLETAPDQEQDASMGGVESGESRKILLRLKCSLEKHDKDLNNQLGCHEDLRLKYVESKPLNAEYDEIDIAYFHSWVGTCNEVFKRIVLIRKRLVETKRKLQAEQETKAEEIVKKAE